MFLQTKKVTIYSYKALQLPSSSLTIRKKAKKTETDNTQKSKKKANIDR